MARIQGEPTVPGKIPGGVASRPIPGRVVRTLGRELVFPGMIPSGVVSRPIPGGVVRTLGGELVFPGMIPGGVASRLLLFIAAHLFVLAGGAYSHQRALGWPVNARRRRLRC